MKLLGAFGRSYCFGIIRQLTWPLYYICFGSISYSLEQPWLYDRAFGLESRVSGPGSTYKVAAGRKSCCQCSITKKSFQRRFQSPEFLEGNGSEIKNIC